MFTFIYSTFFLVKMMLNLRESYTVLLLKSYENIIYTYVAHYNYDRCVKNRLGDTDRKQIITKKLWSIWVYHLK